MLRICGRQVWTLTRATFTGCGDSAAGEGGLPWDELSGEAAWMCRISRELVRLVSCL